MEGSSLIVTGSGASVNMEGSDEQSREAVIREVGDILRASLERMADEIRDLAGVERYVQGMLRRVGSVTVNRLAAWRAQAAERPDCPRCGRPMEVRNRRARRYVGLVGDVEIQRTEYGCRTCGEGVVPEDPILELGPGCLSPELTRVVTGACAEIPSFERAAAMIRKTLGVSLTAATAARATEAIGAVVEQEMQEDMAEGIPPTPEAEQGPLVLMVGMDTTKAHAGGQWRDVKVAVVAPLGPEVVTNPETGRGTLRLGPRTYGAGIEDADRFYDRVMVLAQRAGWHPTRSLKVVLLGDGGPWIWARADRFRAEGIEGIAILDLYHAREHI